MDALSFELNTLCRKHPQGSHATRAARSRALSLFAGQLKEGGYRLPSARSLKPKHIEHLVSRWQAEKLTPGTLKNRLGHVRTWATWINKTSILESNEAYGIAQRESFKGNRAKPLDYDRLEHIADPHTRASVKLQAAFGLRREEAIKFTPRIADKGDRIVLKPSWTKGGRYREIPITHPKQRAILDEVAELAAGGALIPDGKRYIDQMRVYEHGTLKAGLRNNHGLRHAYAQWRYQKLTGWKCPAAGGPKVAQMTPAMQAVDREARMEIAEELGHGRIDVTNTYLGGRS